MRALEKIWPWCAAILSGLLYAAAFPPFDQAWLCWIALTPLAAAVWFAPNEWRRPWLRNLLLGYLAGFVFFTIVFSWLGSLSILYDNVFLRGLSALLSIYLAFYLAVWAWLVGLLRPRNFTASWRNLLLALIAASAWCALEWIRGWLFGGFGWNGLGVALHGQWLVIQIAEFTGVVGLSFVIAFANIIAVVTPMRLYFEARQHRMRPHWDLNLTMLMVMALLAIGWRAAKNASPSRPLRVAAVQGGIPQRQKQDRQFAAEIFERYSRLSDMALQMNPRPELLIWPESATPGPAFGDEETFRFISEFAARADVDLLLGTDEVEPERAYNSAVLIAKGGQDAQTYRKMHLVPFGEYIPLRHSFPPFAAIAGRWVPGDFNRGEDYTVFRLTNSDVRVAPLICFEDTIGELVRQFVVRDADLLVNVTNDGWFDRSAGSRQHLANAIFRCVETRRPMVRAANTGVTCFVNESGRIIQILQDDTGSTFGEGVLTGKIDIAQDRQLTFYTRHGELFAQVCTVVALLGMAGACASRRGKATRVAK